MRLHRLEITAFGPFSGTETIDFDTLSDAGLFLIHGQTGAGKTSVLDAVCFALYGTVPGARGKTRQGLRSDHAASGVEPRVVLETTIRGRRFRFTQSPAWARPKRRGTGTTPENAKVLVEEYEHGGWTGLTKGKDEAGNLVMGLLGMNAEQFCQVALLPQGEFAAFLRAGAEERRAVLERLFAAEVYARVEKWLTDHRAETGRRAAEQRRVAETSADRIAEVAGTPRPGAVLVPAPRQAEQMDEPLETVEELLPWAAELAGQLDAVLSVTKELARESARTLERTGEQARQGEALADRQRRHADAGRRRAALAERAGERAELDGRLDHAVRAERVMPLVNNAAELARRAERVRLRAAETRAAAGALVPGGMPDDVLAKAEQDRRDEAAGLERLREEAARERALTAEATTLLQRTCDLEAQEVRLSARLERLPAEVDEARAEREDLRVRMAGRPGAKAAAADLTRRLEAAEDRDLVIVKLADAEEAYRKAVDEAQHRRDHHQAIQQERLDGMAATLAGRLVEGESCPVCGSREHPDPAVPHDDAPTAEDEEDAANAFEQARNEREDARARVEGLRAERDKLLEFTEAPAEALAAALAQAQVRLAALDDDAAKEESVAVRLRALERELEEARGHREAVGRQLAEMRTRHAETTGEVARLRETLDTARGTDPTLEARIDRLTREAEALRAAFETARQASIAAEQLAEARTAAGQAAEEAGFDDVRHARNCAMEQRDREALQRRLRAFDDEKAQVAALLDDAELMAAAARPVPDLDALHGAEATARQAATAAASAFDAARKRADRLTELRAELETAVKRWRPAAERHAVVSRVAALASGQHPDNVDRMRLSAFVLAARLIQVVDAANERLARMSSGRYALEHTVERAAADGRRRGAVGGLGLRVADSWTGRTRDPATLSGGESFITSLALALGLADVVTAESAAGAEIGTLFVDEGFGTLDEDTLEEVMEVLDGLRDGGRAVGIVSHVAELRGRIPAQLRVRKERTGSTAAVTV